MLLLALALSVALPVAQARAAKTLDVYVVDVEGGSAVLYVLPLVTTSSSIQEASTVARAPSVMPSGSTAVLAEAPPGTV